jgi:hypothetical protein
LCFYQGKITHGPPENPIPGEALATRSFPLERIHGEREGGRETGYPPTQRRLAALGLENPKGHRSNRKFTPMNPFNREEHAHRVDRELLYMILESHFLIFQKLDKMSNELQNLKDAAAKTLTVEEAVLQVLNSQKATIDGLSKQLADAVASNDPAAIQAVTDGLNMESDKVSAAIAALQPPAQTAT